MINLAQIKERGSISPEELEELIAGKQADETAHLARAGAVGALDKFAGTDFMGLPVGGAVVGIATSTVVSALVAKFAPAGPGALLAGTWGKLGLAWVAKQWLTKPLGSKTTDAMAFVLIVDAVSGWVKQMVGGLMGGLTLKQTMTGGAIKGNGHVSSIAEYNRLMGIA